jgi:hypothetical protein
MYQTEKEKTTEVLDISPKLLMVSEPSKAMVTVVAMVTATLRQCRSIQA